MKAIQTRRPVCKLFVVIGFSVCLSVWGGSSDAAKADPRSEEGKHKEQFKKTSTVLDSRPNVVIILADDMGWGDMGANWPKTVDTPNLDSLAREGLRFTDFHAGASVCAPSRAALLTGRLGLRTGVIENFGEAALGGIPSNETTLAELLYQSGYRTAMLGKWHLGTRAGHHPLDKGFQSYLGIPYSVDMGCADPPGENVPECPACPNENSVTQAAPSQCFEHLALPLYKDRDVVHQPVKLQDVSRMFADFAHKFIQRSLTDISPYFLYAALTHIHVPLAHAPAFNNITGRGTFADTLLEMDWLVGQIKKAVDKGRGHKNTLIWFISDNGPWAIKCNLAGSVGPFAGDWQRSSRGGGGGSAAKQTVWEGGHRVPAIVRWPHHVQAGRVSNALSSSLDILPTVVALCNSSLPLHRDLDGQDIGPVIKGTERQGRQFLFHPNSGAAGPAGEIGAVRVGQFKAVYYSGGSLDCAGREGPALSHLDKPLVFNLDTDPAEGSPLDPSTARYRDIASKAGRALSLLRASIRADNVSTAEYKSRKSARPCCDTRSPICRCPWD